MAAGPTSFGTRGSQVQILPLRPEKSRENGHFLKMIEGRWRYGDSYGDRNEDGGIGPMCWVSSAMRRIEVEFCLMVRPEKGVELLNAFLPPGPVQYHARFSLRPAELSDGFTAPTSPSSGRSSWRLARVIGGSNDWRCPYSTTLRSRSILA
jgi:hypothetical protein